MVHIKIRIMKKLVKISMILAIAFSASYYACDDYTEDFDVPPPSTVAKFEFEAAHRFVPPDTITFYNQSIIPERAGTPTFYWNFGNGEQLERTSTDPFTFVYDTVGTFDVSLVIKTSAGDSSFASGKVIMQDLLLGDTLFYEDFEGIQTFPSDWELINVDGNTPDNSNFATMLDSAWIIYSSSYFQGNVALGLSFYNPEAAADDWMITPKITLGNNPVLEWYAMSLTTSGDYPDSYEVYISTTTQDVAGCQANGVLKRVTDEQWGVDSDNPGEGIAMHRLNLNDFANQDVYVAFRIMTPSPGGDRLAIDNINIVDKY